MILFGKGPDVYQGKANRVVRAKSIAEPRALFLGSKLIGLKALQALVEAIPGRVASVVTVDDSADSRSVLTRFGACCSEAGLPLTTLKKPSELASVVHQYSPQIVLVVGWYWILPPDLLKAVPGGFIGAHASLLPKYRGSAPLVWAILRGETRTGVTLFSFNDEMDTGDVIAQRSFAIEPAETIADVLIKAENTTIELVNAYAEPLLVGIAPRNRQDHAQATYGSLRRPEDGRIDWSQPAETVYNFIRAQTQPYPGAFTKLPDGRVLRVWRASIFPYPFYGIPGLVGQKHDDGVVVTCGDNAVVIRECEIQGELVAPASIVLKWAMRLGTL